MDALHTFSIDRNWNLINELRNIERFEGTWENIIKREGQSLKHLKSIATVRSIGASTRIEGSKMTDDEVQVLIGNISIGKLEERDQQEVIGYYEALDIISESFQDMPVTENAIKSLHSALLKYSTKDEWHKGAYKQHANSVEATRLDGTKQTIFQTTAPGWATEDAMRLLVDWYTKEREAHPLVRAATFVYDFLSIHPFQDGNGRLSRLITTLLLLKEQYSWIEYVSFEHEIEHRKAEYYKVLMECQKNRPGEDITPWVLFFIDCLGNIQQQLMQKLERGDEDLAMSPRMQQIRMYIEHHPGARTSEIARKLGLSLPTTKKQVTLMVESGHLIRHGTGAGTNYSAKPRLISKPDRMLKFTGKESHQTFQLTVPGGNRTIKKILLTPLFKWTQPDEWVKKLHEQGLYVFIECINRKGEIFSMQFALAAFNNPYLFQPVFTLSNPIVIPDTLMNRPAYQYEYPLRVNIELGGSVTADDFLFDVLVVYDERG
jgi:Fic family protein